MINSHTHNLKKKHTSGLEQYSDFINVYIASLLMGLSGQNWKFIYQFTMKKKQNSTRCEFDKCDRTCIFRVVCGEIVRIDNRYLR